jgi:hypothetical protein
MHEYDERTRRFEDSLAAALTVEQGALLHYRLTKPPAEQYVLNEEAEEAERTWRDEVQSSPSTRKRFCRDTQRNQKRQFWRDRREQAELTQLSLRPPLSPSFSPPRLTLAQTHGSWLTHG